MSAKLVLLRHGQSTWNLENRFTGWVDVELTENGHAEAEKAGELMRDEGLEFDAVYTSVLKRAITTMQTATRIMNQQWVPVTRSWRLNERHYGALAGLNKAETAAKHGEDQVKIWRRSYDVPPPELDSNDPEHPCNDRRYSGLDKKALPNSESLKMTLERVLPYWHDEIAPQLKAGKTVLVTAHGNSIRALVKYLDNMTAEQVLEVNIPTAIPLYYEFDDELNVTTKRFMGDAAVAEAAAAAVANQGKA